MKQLIHISINFLNDFDEDALKKELDKAHDWLHYMPNCWIVLTSSQTDVWAARLTPLLRDDDSLFITSFDPESAKGLIAKWMIDWFEDAKRKIAVPSLNLLLPGQNQKAITHKPS